jgi:hypothetical protein
VVKNFLSRALFTSEQLKKKLAGEEFPFYDLLGWLTGINACTSSKFHSQKILPTHKFNGHRFYCIRSDGLACQIV